MTLKNLLCKVCNEHDKQAAYKCPTCRIHYCSVQCWKTHQTQKCVPVRPQKDNTENQTKNSTSYQHPTEDTIPQETLALLRDSEKLKEILANPYVKDMLMAIDKSPNPYVSIKAAMQEPIFTEFAEACLQVVQPDSELVPK